MDISRIDAALGLAFDSPPVQALVVDLGVTGTPKPKKDDPDAFLVSKSAGVDLMFVDRDYLDRTEVLRYGNADMVFVGATLYSGRQTGDPSFRRFQGALPGQATFDDTVDDLVRKLGPPSETFEDEGVVLNRVWYRDQSEIGFNYNPAGALQYVQINWKVYMDRIDDLED